MAPPPPAARPQRSVMPFGERDHREFWDKIKRGAPDECWPWTGYVKPANGHGLTTYRGTPVHASRKAWILTNGYPAEGLCVLHRCDNKLCCNPAHLYLGTGADNMIDYWGNTPADERGQRHRRTVLNEGQLQRLYRMRANGARLTECAQEFGVHISTICRYITPLMREKIRQIRAARLSSSQK